MFMEKMVLTGSNKSHETYFPSHPLACGQEVSNLATGLRSKTWVSRAPSPRQRLQQVRLALSAVAVAVFLAMTGATRAQQEVAPDHFDSPSLFVATAKAKRSISRVARKSNKSKIASRARARRASRGA